MNFPILFLTTCLSIISEPEESLHLKNVQQLTVPAMGFERAGEAYFSPDGKTIAFQAVPTGKEYYQIYVMNLEEKIPRMVSTGKGACTCAYFHPYEKKMIFASSHSDPQIEQLDDSAQVPNGTYKWDFTPYMNIYEANWDGTELTALTSGPAYHAECAYSSDGTQIVYASNEDETMNLYTMDRYGSHVRQVTHSVNCYNGGPFFSPDNSKIIFRADPERAHFLQIYVVDVDGNNLRKLTDNQAVNWAPYWHPNGKVITFTTSLHGHHRYELYLMNIESGVSSRLTYCPTFDGLPVFSPDGNQLMWTSKRGPDQTSQVFIADFFMPLELE
jgi:TolB protein